MELYNGSDGTEQLWIQHGNPCMSFMGSTTPLSPRVPWCPQIHRENALDTRLEKTEIQKSNGSCLSSLRVMFWRIAYWTTGFDRQNRFLLQNVHGMLLMNV